MQNGKVKICRRSKLAIAWNLAISIAIFPIVALQEMLSKLYLVTFYIEGDKFPIFLNEEDTHPYLWLNFSGFFKYAIKGDFLALCSSIRLSVLTWYNKHKPTKENVMEKKPNMKKVAEIKAVKAAAKKTAQKVTAKKATKKVVAKKTTTKKVVAKKTIAKKK